MADAAPANQLAAKFSIPWAVAAALVLGHGDVDAFPTRRGPTPASARSPAG